METIEINKLKEIIRKLKEKYGIRRLNYPSKLEVLREFERRLEDALSEMQKEK